MPPCLAPASLQPRPSLAPQPVATPLGNLAHVHRPADLIGSHLPDPAYTLLTRCLHTAYTLLTHCLHAAHTLLTSACSHLCGSVLIFDATEPDPRDPSKMRLIGWIGGGREASKSGGSEAISGSSGAAGSKAIEGEGVPDGDGVDGDGKSCRATGITLCQPYGVAAHGREIFVAEEGAHRISVFLQSERGGGGEGGGGEGGGGEGGGGEGGGAEGRGSRGAAYVLVRTLGGKGVAPGKLRRPRGLAILHPAAGSSGGSAGAGAGAGGSACLAVAEAKRVQLLSLDGAPVFRPYPEVSLRAVQTSQLRKMHLVPSQVVS